MNIYITINKKELLIKNQGVIFISRDLLKVDVVVEEKKGIVNFFGDINREMKKVSWPKRKELSRYTIIVLSTVIVTSAFFAIIDLCISFFIRFFLNN
ncbi:preprotein translocase subunit SecE [Metabacillus sp. KUDC1714]|nr:preprotein translocase subunit SecE [Metabacillus sp. KUDC1714]